MMKYATYPTPKAGLPSAPLSKELYIFDLDGTLANTALDIAIATNYACLKLGLKPVNPRLIPGMVGGGINLLLSKALGKYNSPDMLQQARKFFDESYAQNLMKHTRLYPGMRMVLDHLKAKTLAVLSNKPEAYTHQIIEKLGIKENFQLVVGGRRDLPKKPAPDAILHILSALKCKPRHALMIGDTEADIEAARAAGIQSCGVAYGFRTRAQLEAAQPDYLLNEADLICKYFC